LSSCVVIFAQREDVHAERLHSELSLLGVTAFRIDAEQVDQLRISFQDGHFRFDLHGETFRADEVRSVFVRRRPTSRDFGISERGPDVDVGTYVALQKEMLFQDAMFSLQASARFYNSFDSSTRFMGKLIQDIVAKQAGFSVAETLVGSSDHQVVAFIRKIRDRGGRVCTKPLAQKNLERDGVLYTRYTELIDDSIKVENEDFESCPIIFQEYIEKDYELRVTVADKKVMPIRIESQMAPGDTRIDWRKYNIPRTPHSACEIPNELADRILRFHELAGLRFSAFDFIKARDGRYVFLETNPSGQWLWLENITGFPITREIALALCS